MIEGLNNLVLKYAEVTARLLLSYHLGRTLVAWWETLESHDGLYNGRATV